MTRIMLRPVLRGAPVILDLLDLSCKTIAQDSMNQLQHYFYSFLLQLSKWHSNQQKPH